MYPYHIPTEVLLLLKIWGYGKLKKGRLRDYMKEEETVKEKLEDTPTKSTWDGRQYNIKC